MNRKKILIIRFHAIGDVAMTTVIPYAIKLKHPDCEIHYLTTQFNSEMLKNCSYIDKIIPYSGNLSETIKELFKQRYDEVISLNLTIPAFKLAFLSFPKKVIFKSSKGTSWVENYFYTAKKVYKDILLPDRLRMSEDDILANQKITELINQYPKPYIIISPGKLENQPRQGRVWNIEKYKELANSITKTYGGTVFVIGSMPEREYHIQLEAKNVVVLSGMCNLEETCALISQSDLIISGDSGPAHIASLYNKKTLVLLGSTSPDKIKPYGQNGYYIEPAIKCKYCWKKKCKLNNNPNGYSPCIESITPDMVTKKIADCNLIESKK